MSNLRLTEGKPLSMILRFTLPLFLGNMFLQLYNIVDTVVVGRFVGANALAAVGSTGTIMFLVQGFSSGLTTGFTVMTAQCYGAEDYEGTRRSASNAFFLSLIVIVIMTLSSTLFMDPLLHLMNTPVEIYEDAYRYIIVICGGLFCTVFYTLFSAMLTAVGNSKAPLYFLMIGAATNVILDLVFIIVFGMGTMGAALASVISQGVTALCSACYINAKMPFLRLKRNFYRINIPMARRQIRVGLPMAMQFGITSSGTMVLQTAINTFGPVAVASFTAASKVMNLLTQGYNSIGQAMAAYGGQNFGAARPERIRAGVRAAFLSDVVYSLTIGGFILFLARPLMYLFFDSSVDIEAMMVYARPYLYFCISCFIPLGMIFIFRNIMQGCGYGFLPMMGGVVELFARVIPAVIAIQSQSFLLAAACDASAWLSAGLFTAGAYFFYVMPRIERRLGQGKQA